MRASHRNQIGFISLFACAILPLLINRLAGLGILDLACALRISFQSDGTDDAL
jgi:hypothetical protein